MSQAFDQGHVTFRRAPLDDPRVQSGPFWAELRVFLAVAKAKSFNRAAATLNTSQSKVSRMVHRLQDQMGAQLILSSTNGICLTARGKELAQELLLLDERLSNLSTQIRSESRDDEGEVTLCSTEGLAGIFVVPELRDFRDRFPKIRVHLKTPVSLTKFRENQSDIVISYAPSTEKGIESRPIGILHLIPVAAGEYVARYGMPTAANLRHHLFLDHEYYLSETETWRCWRDAVAKGTVAHMSDNSFSYAFMVKEGLGIGLLGSYIVCDRKLLYLDIGVRVDLPLYLLATAERLESRPVQIVYDWLTDIMGSHTPWLGHELNLEVLPQRTMAPTLDQYYSDTGFAIEDAATQPRR